MRFKMPSSLSVSQNCKSTWALSSIQGNRGRNLNRSLIPMLPSETPKVRDVGPRAAGNETIRIVESGYKDRVKDFWQGRSEVYDVNNSFHPPLCADLVGLANPFSGSAVLDIATGTGSVAFAAADAVGPSGRVVGVDITDKMLQQAQAKADALAATNVEFQLGDAETVSFPEQSFDYILCSNGMAYLQNIPAAVMRFHSWLRPGGKLCFNNPQAPMIPLTATLVSLCEKKFGIAPEDAGAALGSEARIRAALGAADFKSIEVTGTQEVKVFEDTTPENFAESIFGMMERFPAAPLSQLLCQQQISELRADYMIAAVPQAETMPRRDGGIVNEFVMLWAVATV